MGRRANWGLVFLLSFIAGIIVFNVLMKGKQEDCYLFCESVRTRFLSGNIADNKVLIYVLLCRLLPFLVLCISMFTKKPGMMQGAVLSYTGILFGVMMVACVICWGMAGLLAGVAGIFPQGVCYVASFLVLAEYQPQRMEKTKKILLIMASVFLWFTGVLLETYLNQMIVRKIFQLL